MTLKQVWMPPGVQKGRRYGLRLLSGILGITVLALLLVVCGVALSFSLGWPREITAAVLCLGVTALALWLAVALGRRSARDAAVYFLTEDDRLYALDARRLSRYGRSVLGYAKGAMETQAFLRRLAEQPFLPADVDEILRVERLRETRGYYAVRCQVRRPNHRVFLRTVILVKGLEKEDMLLQQLERRQSWENAIEPAQNRKPVYIFLSALALMGLAALCVLSHPAVGKLPRGIYFPCLGAAALAGCVLLWLAIRQRRGE